MATILTKKKDTTGAPSSGDLTNSTGGAELAVNTADKRLFTKDSGGAVVEIGTNPTSISTGALNTSGQVVFNDAGANVDFRVEGDTNANLLFVDASADKVGIGTDTPATKFHVSNTSGSTQVRVSSDTDVSFSATATGADSTAFMTVINDARQWTIRVNGSESDQFQIRDSTAGATRAVIDSSGNLLVGKTSNDNTTAGVKLQPSGAGVFVASSDVGIICNRLSTDGNLVDFRQDGVTEGTISVSGNTVSYNPFLGSHSGALADWSRSEIKIGTVMDTIDELLDYKVVVIDVQEEVPAKAAVMDEEGNEVEPAQKATTQTVQKRISYNGNSAVGSTATVEYEGQEYTGTIEHERKEPLSFNKHLKVKVNDTTASKAVFGVFVGWNNDSNNDGGVYNDMLVGAVGNYVIRMAAGQEPQIGDLVEADGNGCAVVQDDDIIRTKTVAKVTSTIKQVTYDDGSFLVTCVLYCG